MLAMRARLRKHRVTMPPPPPPAGSPGALPSLAARVRGLDWRALAAELWERGYARTAPLLTAEECAGLVAMEPEDVRFRSRVDMARLRFGEGRYAYFAHPLPALVRTLRREAYARLAPLADAWMEALGRPQRFPARLDDFLAGCAAAGQSKPTPLLLSYSAGGYNCLHRDVYGEVLFPLQLACFLSRPGIDYDGGEFLLVEQRPRAQSRGEAITCGLGEMLIFPCAERPLETRRGFARAPVRHGVSRVAWGARHTLGVIFHDAR